MGEHEISQAQFDEANALQNQIDELKIKQREAGSLQEKLNIRYEICRLIEKRYQVLGL